VCGHDQCNGGKQRLVFGEGYTWCCVELFVFEQKCNYWKLNKRYGLVKLNCTC